MSGPPVLLVDPGNFTPFYDVQLGNCLADRGWRVEWLTSRSPFEDVTLPARLWTRVAFCPFLDFRQGFGARLRRTRRLRRIARAASYPADLARLDRHLASRPPGILHVQWAHAPWLDAMMWRRWRRRRWRVVYTVHDARPLAGTTPRLLHGVLLPGDRILVTGRSF